LGQSVAVVGAGIAGVSAARFLAARGHDVTLFEQFPFGHDRGSSHGRSRIVRRAYPDALYTRYMAEAYPLWAELQSASPLPILHECGLMYFGSAMSPEMVSMAAGLKELGVPHQILDPGQTGSIMPQLRLDRGEIAVHTPEAGWVNAEQAVRASLDIVVSLGAAVRFGVKAEIETLERSYDSYVICAGAWIQDFLPLQVTVELYTFTYFEGLLEGPVWIEDSPDNAYGFPSEPGQKSFKVGIHRGGVPSDPDQPNRNPTPMAITKAADAAERRFGFKSPSVVEAKGCLYTTAPNDDFRLGRIGSKGFFASACSGHGFKFGPWIGKLMADFVDQTDRPENYPRFN
jgi:sarcosine oxidase